MTRCSLGSIRALDEFTMHEVARLATLDGVTSRPISDEATFIEKVTPAATRFRLAIELTRPHPSVSAIFPVARAVQSPSFSGTTCEMPGWDRGTT